MKNSNTLIFFDFDYTLFDAEKWRNITYEKLAILFKKDYRVFEPLVKSAYAKSKEGGYFDPHVFAVDLIERQSLSVSVSEVLDVIYSQETFKESYHQEVAHILKQLPSVAKLGIFSTNQKEFFLRKFVMIEEYFDKEFIFVAHDKNDIIDTIIGFTEKYQVILVDDLIDMLQLVKEKNKDITTIWIRRGIYAEKVTDPTPFKPDFTFLDTSDILSVVKDAR